VASLKEYQKKSTCVLKKRSMITRAMNMVAASKFKSAQSKEENFRPIAKSWTCLNSLALRVENISHPPFGCPRSQKRLGKFA